MALLTFHDVHNATQALLKRDARTQLTPTPTQKITLIVAGVYIVAIGILWHVPYLEKLLYPFKLLTVGFHEFSHAIVGVLTCATIHSIELDPDEGGSTSMSGGVRWLTLPAGYLGSSFIGATLIACGFDTSASKIASIVLAVVFLLTLYWARREWLTWILIIFMGGLIILFWFVADAVALRYFILFMGVMSCMYVLWDVLDDTIKRKVNASDASAFARICGCCPSRVWGIIWLMIAFIYFAAGVLVGLVAFKKSAADQKQESRTFLPFPPKSKSGAFGIDKHPDFLTTAFAVVLGALGLV